MDYRKEKWAFVKVNCADGVERLGIHPEAEADDERIVKSGMHYDYAVAVVGLFAKGLDKEVYNDLLHEQIEY